MSNTLFHNKLHLTNHHTLSTPGYPDSGIDPIASESYPFLGTFYNLFTFNNTSIDTDSSDWYSAYTSLCASSAVNQYNNYPFVVNTVIPLSAGWSRGYSFYSTYRPISANLNEMYSIVNANSANWPYLDLTLRLQTPQENTGQKNFDSKSCLAPSILSSTFNIDFISVFAPDGKFPINNLNHATLVRDSSGTFTDASGALWYSGPHEMRLDYKQDPVTGNWLPQGLLIEESRTNLIEQSNDIVDVAWEKRNGTGLSYYWWPDGPVEYLAPDFVSFADRVSALGTGTDSLYTAANGTPGTRYEPSFYIKKNTFTGLGYIVIENLAGSNYGQWVINFENLSPVNWERVTRDNQAVRIVNEFTADPTGDVSLTFYQSGAIDVDFYLWGVQLEEGTFSTSLIPTDGAPYTRATEYMVLSGDIFTNVEGTFLVETKTLGYSATNSMVVFRCFDSTQTREITLQYNPTNFTATTYGLVSYSPALGFLLDSPLNTKTYNRTFGVSYARNNVIFADSGRIVGTDTSTLVIQGLSTMHIGVSSTNGFGAYNGYIRQIGFFPQLLSQNQLKLLTLSGNNYDQYDRIETYDWALSSDQVAFIPLSTTSLLINVASKTNMKRGGEYILITSQDYLGQKRLLFDTDYILPGNFDPSDIISLSAFSITSIRFTTNGNKLFGKPNKFYYSLEEPFTYYGGPGINLFPNPKGMFEGEVIAPNPDAGLITFGNVPYFTGTGIIIIYDGV